MEERGFLTVELLRVFVDGSGLGNGNEGLRGLFNFGSCDGCVLFEGSAIPWARNSANDGVKLSPVYDILHEQDAYLEVGIETRI